MGYVLLALGVAAIGLWIRAERRSINEEMNVDNASTLKRLHQIARRDTMTNDLVVNRFMEINSKCSTTGVTAYFSKQLALNPADIEKVCRHGECRLG